MCHPWIFISSRTPATDELGCPLLYLTDTIFIVKTSAVLNAVSVVHKCESSCQFVSRLCPRNVERENISTYRLEYEHDYCGNYNYCLNVFCMKY